MNISSEERLKGQKALSDMANSMITDKNRVAKAIAVFVRNKIEDFHVKYLSDEQMRLLNPLIRNSVYSFLIDFGNDYSQVATPVSIRNCSDYIINNIAPFLMAQGLTTKTINIFTKIIRKEIDLPLIDLSNGGQMLAGYEWMYVPDYWEDCVYNPKCKDSLNS